MQKRKIIKIFVVFFLFTCFCNNSVATQEEILQNQQESLNIKWFVEEANNYTKDAFSDVNANDLMNDAIKGQIDNKTLLNKILNLFGKEIRQTLQIVREYCCNYCYT